VNGRARIDEGRLCGLSEAAQAAFVNERRGLQPGGLRHTGRRLRYGLLTNQRSSDSVLVYRRGAEGDRWGGGGDMCPRALPRWSAWRPGCCCSA